MSLPSEKLLTPEDEELARKKARLVELEAQLADRELELASSRADLVHFEKRYLQTVGRRYAILDELKAKIVGSEGMAKSPARLPSPRAFSRPGLRTRPGRPPLSRNVQSALFA